MSGRGGKGLTPRPIRIEVRGLGLPVALLAMALAANALSGCGSFWGSKKEIAEDNDPPDVIYGKAEAMINKGSYADAAKEYEEVDINHPYSQEARRAIVMAAYAYYKAGKYDEAVSAADRYLTLHPGTQEADLAQNIIGMSYYAQVLDPTRDQTFARKSLSAYETLLQRYPDSRYAAEAANRARILRDLLAASEMTVGRYYLRRNEYLAAINRFRTVVTSYQTTEQVEEALMRLTEAYMALGIVNEAQTAAAVLGHNFPESKWYGHAYDILQRYGVQPQEHEGSWITQTFKGNAPPA
ncbi:outer membrane protein assembly factor BamD [Methyloceanibacter sp.]|uniref:outer membrane protein assembly factor BamD n=1 Tax=Methyloceanibacter sp. TaxID=1965321 RepID=UPI002D5523D3|nr:outer membrane protein assembly factor BamD [Methyloceanibacter sp.]HZP10728.1 outer membrane protein assembly factor BamD [Methyloceanibacter sp.]